MGVGASWRRRTPTSARAGGPESSVNLSARVNDAEANLQAVMERSAVRIADRGALKFASLGFKAERVFPAVEVLAFLVSVVMNTSIARSNPIQGSGQ